MSVSKVSSICELPLMVPLEKVGSLVAAASIRLYVADEDVSHELVIVLSKAFDAVPSEAVFVIVIPVVHRNHLLKIAFLLCVLLIIKR